jgi:hypothetical protein
MRKDNVIALLDHASNDLKNIEQQYEQALSEKKIPTSLQIDVKNFMENLRSALDYMAHDIYEVIIKPERDNTGAKAIEKIYFPYGKTENDFKSGLGSRLPNLQSLNPNIFAIIETIQPHKCSDAWLYEFCRIVNEKKHDTLSPQTKTERQTMTASAGDASVTMPINSPNFSVHQGQNVKVTLGGVPVRFSNQGIEPLAPGLERTITTWVSFQFAGTNIQVLPLLKKALEEITTLSSKIYKELE